MNVAELFSGVYKMDKLKSMFLGLFCSQSRISWRRITVLALSSALLMIDEIGPEAWTTIALVYIGGDSVEKALGAFRK